MPVGAVIGGAVIGAGGSIASGAMGASAQKKAANTAADTSLAVADKNNALFRETRGQNIQIAAPFYNNGVAAGNALNELLLGPNAATAPGAGVQPLNGTGALSGYGGQPDWNAYLQANPDISADFARNRPAQREFGSPLAYAQWHYANYGQQEGRALPTIGGPTAPAVPATPTSGATGSGGALDAFDRFRQGTNYQFRYNQGLNATKGSFAVKGALDSGAATKAAENYGQNIASAELSNYMNLLAGQQNVGLSAGNAIMGVSTAATNAIAGQNTNAGNVAANAALAAGNANANMWGTVGNATGQLGGALFQYGMGQMSPSMSIAASNPNYVMPVSSSISNPQVAASVPVNWGGF